MNPIHYLYAAYIATGIIHLTYLGSLVARYKRIRRKMQAINLQE